MKLTKTNNSLKIIIATITLVASVYLPCTVSAADTAIVSVSTPNSVNTAQQFTVNITVQPDDPIAGAQFNLSFNPSMVTVNSITEGNLLNQNGAGTYFMPGTINNTDGTITGVAGAIIGNGQTVSTSGTLAVITMTARVTGGACPFTLSNVIVGDTNGQSVPVNMVNGQVIINVVTTTTSPPPVGGGGIFVPTLPGITNVANIVDNNGVFTQGITAPSNDNAVFLRIEVGTVSKTADGSPLTQVTITKMNTPPDPPTGAMIVSATYEFGPAGTTFDPTAVLKIIYDPSNISAGVSEDSLAIGYYDDTAKTWYKLTSVVDLENHAVTTTKVGQFALFAVMSGLTEAPPATTPTPTTPTPTPTTPTSTTTPTTTETTTPALTETTSTTPAGLTTTIEPPTTPNNPPSDDIPTFRLAFLASTIGVAVFLITVTTGIILLRRRNLLNKGDRLN